MKHIAATLAMQALAFATMPFYMVRTLINAITALHRAAVVSVAEWAAR